MQWRREENEARRERKRHRNREEEDRRDKTHSAEEGVAEKRARTDKIDKETEAGGEEGTSQSLRS